MRNITVAMFRLNAFRLCQYITMIYSYARVKTQKDEMPPPGGLEPPTFRLTAERASRLRHGGS